MNRVASPEWTVSAATQGGRGPALTDSEQIAAAKATSKGASCSGIRPFYCEVGERTGSVTGSTPKSGASTVNDNARTPVPLCDEGIETAHLRVRRAASSGQLDLKGIKLLTQRSGYCSLCFVRTVANRGPMLGERRQRCLRSGGGQRVLL